jgi:hypothetical protein
MRGPATAVSSRVQTKLQEVLFRSVAIEALGTQRVPSRIQYPGTLDAR